MKNEQYKAVRAVSTSPGIGSEYRKEMEVLVDEMEADVRLEIESLYERKESVIVMDASPAELLAKRLEKLEEKWSPRFSRKSLSLAANFVKKVIRHVDRAQKSAALSAGIPDITVKFQKGRVGQDRFDAIVQENVSLIKSIPTEFFPKIEGAVMRSITAGGDKKELAESLSRHYGVTRRRAAFIARDQNDKATNVISLTRNIEAGYTHGVWQHVAGRKSSRESHVHMNGKTFDLKKGVYDSTVKRYVMPGELPGCRCRFRPLFNFGDLNGKK